MSARDLCPGRSGALALGADEVATRARRGGAAPRHLPLEHRAHRLARPLLARADGRGRDAGRAASPTARSARATSPGCSPPACSRAAPIRLRLGTSGGAAVPRRGRHGSPSPAAASPIRCRSTTTAPMAAVRGLERAIGARSRRRSSRRSIQSGLRGRGGAGFPTGIKWKHRPPDAQSAQKYIVCNADEGDSGTFADRMMMEGDPFVLIEGMAIAGIAVGRDQGLRLHPLGISARHRGHGGGDRRRAPRAAARRQASPARAHDFDIEIRVGAGAYVCGEETALLDSLEGKRGKVRAKPPLPAHHGLFGKPTVINNVHLARLGAGHPGRGRGVLSRFRHGPLARHHADPARRQRASMAACSKPPSA